MPKVSVIVPNYNHATYLNQRLDSIFSQTFKDFYNTPQYLDNKLNDNF